MTDQEMQRRQEGEARKALAKAERKRAASRQARISWFTWLAIVALAAALVYALHRGGAF